MITAAVIDYETTGIDPETADPLQIAVGTLNITPYGIHTHPVGWKYIHFAGPIPSDAKAIHHISEADVGSDSAVSHQEALRRLIPTELDFFIAHNAEYDRAIYKRAGEGPNTSFFCTYRAARRLWPSVPSHTNQALRYELGLVHGDGFLDRAFQLPPHHAAHDVFITRELFIRIWTEITDRREEGRADLPDPLEPADLCSWCWAPLKLDVMPFGKHKGETFSSIPSGYLHWLLRQGDSMDRDVLYTARLQLSSGGGW